MAEKIKVTSDSTIPQVLDEVIKVYPQHLAQIDGDERLTYKEFGEKIHRLASALINLGVKPGEKVAMVLPDSNAFPIGMYAAIKIGAVSVGINPTLRPDEFKHILSDSDAVAVVVSAEIHGVDPISIIRDMRGELPNLKHVIVVGNHKDGELNFQQLIENATINHEYHQAHPDELAALIYTSGTTGLPKGSMHSHRTMLYPKTVKKQEYPLVKKIINIFRRHGWRYLLKALKVLNNPYKVYSSMPPYTGAGTMGVLYLFLNGFTVVHMDRFTPTKVLELIEKEKLEGIGLPPALGTMLTRHPKLNNYDLSSLVYVLLASAPVPPSLIDEFKEKIGCPVINGFGATEMFGGPTSLDPFADSLKALRETVGKVKPDYEVKVVDEDRNTLPLGEVGELVVRSGVKMLGYYKDPELTQRTFDPEGWYFTGDQATMDVDGYVKIVGRIKDMIIRGGQNIYPAELESVLQTHPKINQASVIGVPDPIAGEKVLAYIIPEGGNNLTPVDVLNFCREKMAPYKVPANVYLLDSFPLNATGKVLKRVLRENAMAAI
jgi:acyl-CoA synthetase (AMP-forming)/AMP-acid ligase II